MQYEIATVSGEAGPPVASSCVAWAVKMTNQSVPDTAQPECTTSIRQGPALGNKTQIVLTTANVVHSSAYTTDRQRPSAVLGQYDVHTRPEVATYEVGTAQNTVKNALITWSCRMRIAQNRFEMTTRPR